MSKKDTQKVEIDVLVVDKGVIEFCVLGTSPLICNRPSQKVLQGLLLPRPGRMNAAEKMTNLKHNPLEEYRNSPYTSREASAPTLIEHLAAAFKKTISSSAIDMPGASKAQIGRLCWVEGERIPIYGVPQMLMSVVRSADMKRTPDVRTRAIIPRWACKIRVSYTKPLLRESTVANLLAFGGISQGIGDYRTEKGAGTYGSFELVSEDDIRYQSVLKEGGRKAQVSGLENPEFYDLDTEELYNWFLSEMDRRQSSGDKKPKLAKKGA